MVATDGLFANLLTTKDIPAKKQNYISSCKNIRARKCISLGHLALYACCHRFLQGSAFMTRIIENFA